MSKKERIRYEGARPLLVIPYIIATSAALMYTICRDYMLPCTAVMGVLACSVFMLLYRFRNRRGGVLVILLLLAAMLGTSAYMMGSMFVDDGFMDFIFTASNFFNPLYAAAAIVIFSVIIGFMSHYFSVTMPRMCFLMLVAYIPLILSSRTAGGLPLWLLAPMAGTYVLALCGSARQCEPQDVSEFRDRSGSRQRAFAAVLLAVVAAVVAVALPKSGKTPMGEYLNQVFLRGEGYYNGNERLSNFVSSSSVNTGDNDSAGTLLFTVQTDAPMLIDRWVFDVYAGEEGWHYLDDYNTGYASWELYEQNSRSAELSNTLRRAAKNGELEGYQQLAELPRLFTATEYMFIRVMDGSSTKVVLHPLPTEQVEITDYAGNIYRTRKGELFTEKNLPSASYLVTYQMDDSAEEFARAVNGLDFSQLLYDAAADGVIDNSTYSAFEDEHKIAQSYKQRTGEADGISDELRRLALEITADCTTDYDRMRAIESWFGSNGFLYDLDFVPRSAEVDYFVFDSRRGICSDFATAVTLMARAVGLPARYVEGFALRENMRDENGVYNVTSDDAHAYSQIYIAGCGWLNADATRFVPKAEKKELTPLQIVIIAVSCLLLAALIVLAVLNRELLSWAAFSLTYPMRNERSAVAALAKRMQRTAASMAGRRAENMSLGEAEDIIAKRLSMGAQAAELRAAADMLLYSGSQEVQLDKKRLYRCMSDILKRKRRMKR